MKVVNYLTSVPRGNTNKQKEELLMKFHNGVQRTGDESHLHREYFTVDCDAALIQGWVYNDTTPSHLSLRKKVIEHQQKTNRYTIVADANLFLYANKINPQGYLRYSLNGVFPDTGIYCDNNIDETRWNQISINTGIRLEENKKNGSHILILLQRQGGWSMGGYDVEQWAIDTIGKIRQHTDRPIIVRPHPGDKKAPIYLNPTKTKLKNMPNVKISLQGRPLEEELSKAWAVVNHNSSAAVGPIIQGHHCFITDPLNSQNKEVSNTDFSKIDKPDHFDRQRWLQRISMFHWSFDELDDGSCWQHMRNYCQ